MPKANVDSMIQVCSTLETQLHHFIGEMYEGKGMSVENLVEVRRGCREVAFAIWKELENAVVEYKRDID